MTITTRKSKIARLPRNLRDELNQRIDNGTPGPQILEWLNSLPEVQSVLAEYFERRPITKQNLSEWRQGGYQDWFKLQETRDLTLQLAEQPDTLDTGINPRKISESFATIATAHFIRASQARLDDCTTTTQRWKCVCDTQRELSRLRRDNFRTDNLKLQQERWDYQVATRQNQEKKPEVQASPLKSMLHLFMPPNPVVKGGYL